MNVLGNIKNKFNIKDNILFIILVLQPFLDILAYIQEGSFSIAGYIRLCFVIAIPLYALLVTKDKKLIIELSVIAVYALLHIMNCFRLGYGSIFSDVKQLLSTLSLPLLLFSFIALYDKEKILKQVLSALKIIIIVTVAVFWISYILKSGNYTYVIYKKGWTGWYMIPNAQSIILLSILPFSISFAMDKFKKLFPLILIPVLAIYVLNGTRIAYYGCVLTLIGFFVFEIVEYFVKKEKSFPIYRLTSLLLLVVLMFVFYSFSPCSFVQSDAATKREEEQMMWDEANSDQDPDLDTDEALFDDTELSDSEKGLYTHLNKTLLKRFGKERVLKAYGKLDFYKLANVRLLKRVFGQLVWEECDFPTKLVGFEFSKITFEGDNFDLENDPSALLYYNGYLGAFLYLAMLLYFGFRIVKSMIKDLKSFMDSVNFAACVATVLQIGAAVYAGYLLRRPNVSIYLMVTLLIIYVNTQSKKAKITENEAE